jgi:hypothetical protein
MERDEYLLRCGLSSLDAELNNRFLRRCQTSLSTNIHLVIVVEVRNYLDLEMGLMSDVLDQAAIIRTTGERATQVTNSSPDVVVGPTFG